MDLFYKTLIDYGALGILTAVLLWQFVYLQRKLFSVIENNNKVLNELKLVIERCTYKHTKDF